MNAMTDKKSEDWSWQGLLWAFLLIVVAPNLVFIVSAELFALDRPYINFDYAIVALACVLKQRILCFVLLFVAFFFDVLALVGQIFPVFRLSDVVYLASFAGLAPWDYKLAMALGLLSFVFLFALFINKRNQNIRVELLFGINGLLLLYVFFLVFVEEEGSRVWRYDGNSVIASQTVLGYENRQQGFVEAFTETFAKEGPMFDDKKAVGATDFLFNDLENINDKVLLVVSESWGVTDKKIQEAVVAPLLSDSKYFSQQKQGEIDFIGLTIQAEMRELCQVTPRHFNFTGHEERLKGCLPNALKDRGYSTHAFHGAAGLMYDRLSWYPDIGFTNNTFFENHSWPRRCYSFPGACDSDMARHVKESLQQNGKVFSYWLTLNSHYSYDERDIHNDDFDCESVGVPAETITCRNLKLHAQFFSNLADMLKSPGMSGVRVVVVGDHDPPIGEKEEKENYFVEGKVPWLSLVVDYKD